MTRRNIREYFHDKIVEYSHSNIFSAGYEAEDVVVDDLTSNGWKVIRADQGSTADSRWKVDLLAWKVHDVAFIQVKNGEGFGYSFPQPPKWVEENLNSRGFKTCRQYIVVANGEIVYRKEV